MTMSDIRMQEAWAMAHWLARADPPAFGIEDDVENSYDLLHWQDGAITRVDRDDSVPQDAHRLYEDVPGTSIFAFIVEMNDGRFKFFEHPLDFIPFSTYDLGGRPPQSLALHYSPPVRKKKQTKKKGKKSKRGGLAGLPPRGMSLVCHGIRDADQCFELTSSVASMPRSIRLSRTPKHGKLIRAKVPDNCILKPIDQTQ